MRSDETMPYEAMARSRQEQMCRMRAEGASLRSIAETFGVTRERVRQIIKDAGGPTREDAIAARRSAVAATRQTLREQALELCRARPTMSMAEVADQLGVKPSTLRAAVGADARRFLVGTRRGTAVFTDEQLLDHLRQASALVPPPLTVRKYNAARAQFGGASAPLILQRFGTWRAACSAAGVSHGAPVRENYQRRWTDEQLVAAVAAYLAEPRAMGSFADYERWARSRAGAPSGQTIRNQLGRWSRAKALGLRRLPEEG